MSAQLELIMQLYMMNLLQQQQQQQQQQHQQQLYLQQSPTKQTDITSSTIAAATTTATADAATTTAAPHQHQQNSRTQLRKNSQNTNCSSSSSSSSSCSPNSNFSPNNIPNTNYPFTSITSLTNPTTQTLTPTASRTIPQMLLLNNLPSLTQLMMAQQHNTTPIHTIIPSIMSSSSLAQSNSLLLTPTTPNSSMMMTPSSKTLSMMDYFSSNNIPNSFAPPHFLPQQFTNSNNHNFSASNFLQSSTVTSTPTEQKSPSPIISSGTTNTTGVLEPEDNSTIPEARGAGSMSLSSSLYVVDSKIVNDVNDDEMIVSGNGHRTGPILPPSMDSVDDDDEEDDKPLSSLYSSLGTTAASTSAGSMESGASSSKLLLSGVQALESTTDSLDSTSNMPYTPTKQSADSSFSSNMQKPLASSAVTISSSDTANPLSTDVAVNEDSNVTPLTIASTILTPPSSEQLAANTFEPSQTAQSGGSTAIGNLTTASSLDAFLQNEENLKNLKKYTSYLECENRLCRQENLREHFHCFDEPCQGRTLSKKDDIIRHLKWHKKRKESLLLGFARFSSSDDCAPAYGAGCAYCWKQTHYHCVYEDCPKVYVSTSDVQMHANFHRKNSEIVQEGFRRFRAHENCKIEECPFYGKKMSHYHCCREGCNHTFKNKADMDKHKTYHLKDYQLTQDGFKKILKTEVCPFEDCKFSTVCNHIHCVRENCNYILHSSSQMISHKRKHDRLDGEQAYQNYKKQKDSSEEESPTAPAAVTQQQQQQQQQQPQHINSNGSNSSNSNTSTPLSSLSADHFLSRKRGRPPKKIQLPAETSNDCKRIKAESHSELTTASTTATINAPNPAMCSSLPITMFPPFLPNFNAAAVAAATQEPNTSSNFQLTHLMALFQLQNPLFYQNIYPGGMSANMANMLSAAAAAGVMPQNAATATSMFGNLAAFSATAGIGVGSSSAAATEASIKSEFSDKQPFKE